MRHFWTAIGRFWRILKSGVCSELTLTWAVSWRPPLSSIFLSRSLSPSSLFLLDWILGVGNPRKITRKYPPNPKNRPLAQSQRHVLVCLLGEKVSPLDFFRADAAHRLPLDPARARPKWLPKVFWNCCPKWLRPNVPFCATILITPGAKIVFFFGK